MSDASVTDKGIIPPAHGLRMGPRRMFLVGHRMIVLLGSSGHECLVQVLQMLSSWSSILGNAAQTQPKLAQPSMPEQDVLDAGQELGST